MNKPEWMPENPHSIRMPNERRVYIESSQDTLKAVIERLEQPCTEHPMMSSGKFPYVRFEGKPFYEHRYNCPKCMQELKLSL